MDVVAVHVKQKKGVTRNWTFSNSVRFLVVSSVFAARIICNIMPFISYYLITLESRFSIFSCYSSFSNHKMDIAFDVASPLSANKNGA